MVAEAAEVRAHPITKRLKRRGDIARLARRVGYGYNMTYLALHGRRRASRRFRTACSLAMGVPEAELFLPDPEEEL